MVSPRPSQQDFPLRWAPAKEEALPVLVTIPHYGVEAVPEFDPTAWSTPDFIHFAHGFADPFAALIYGEVHRQNVNVLASPYSRLFVDLNRARDDYECEGERVESRKGVVRTHTLSGRALFSDDLSQADAESRLSRYYDPYHDQVVRLIESMTTGGQNIVLLDAHTALSKRFGDREIIVSTQRGKTANPGRGYPGKPEARHGGDCRQGQ